MPLNGPQAVFVVDPSDTVADIKKQAGVPAEQVLTHGGKVLEDARTLADLNITKDATLIATVRLHGGGTSQSVTTLIFERSAAHVAAHGTFKRYNIIIEAQGGLQVFCYDSKRKMEEKFNSLHSQGTVRTSWAKTYAPYFASHDNADVKCHWLCIDNDRNSHILGLIEPVYTNWLGAINFSRRMTGKTAIEPESTPPLSEPESTPGKNNKRNKKKRAKKRAKERAARSETKV